MNEQLKTIFLFLKNDLFISDLLKSKYIKYLSDKYRVVIFSSSIPAENVAAGEYFSSPNLTYVEWKVQNPKLFEIFKFMRTNCSHELDFISNMKMYYRSPAYKRDKRARLARWLSWPFAPLMTINFFTRLERFLVKPKKFLEYCEKYKPDLIMTATPGIQVFDAEAILLGQKLGIPTLATNFSWDNLTAFKAVRMRKPDHLFVWNDVIRDAALQIHRFRPDQVRVTGSMRFDKYFDSDLKLPSREEFLRSKKLDPQKKMVLFATVGSNSRPFQTELIRQILLFRSSGKIPDVNLLIRLHPFDVEKNYDEFLNVPGVHVELAGKKVGTRAGERVQIDQQDFLNLKATLIYSDININYKSTISLESLLFDKPVINFIDPSRPAQRAIYYDENSYYRPLIRDGAVRLTADPEEMAKAINGYLADPSLDRSGREKMAQQFFSFRDGFSYKRNVDFLDKILS
ncbi:MAG: CDP-glycerol glycerophosphotransferase family protein [bacterium]|nr:CDP-glycerol glycerophosphotransferase family protein [bacterium]